MGRLGVIPLPYLKRIKVLKNMDLIYRLFCQGESHKGPDPGPRDQSRHTMQINYTHFPNLYIHKIKRYFVLYIMISGWKPVTRVIHIMKSAIFTYPCGYLGLHR